MTPEGFADAGAQPWPRPEAGYDAFFGSGKPLPFGQVEDEAETIDIEEQR
jgi:hypothetical protein